MSSLQTSATNSGPSTRKHGRLRRRWRGLIALQPTDRVLFLKLWSQLAVISVLLRLLVLKQVRRLLTCLISEQPNDPVASGQAISYARHIGHLTRKAGRHLPFDTSCLRQSLLVWWFLRRRGLGTELRIGVNNREEFRAHAWVELEGQPVNDNPGVMEKFRSFDRIP